MSKINEHPAFVASQHIIQLKGKDYLETKYRIQWFRAEHPQGCIATEVVSYDPLLVKATIFSSENVVLATAHAGAVDKGNAVWSGRSVEKAETAAIGRALGHAGYGTQFAGDGNDDDEAESGHLADSPNERRQPQQNGKRDTKAERDALMSNNGTPKRVTRDWQPVFKQVEVWFDEPTEDGRKAHWWNVVKQLQTSGEITDAMSDAQVVELLILNRREKTARQTAQA